jgi:hypothetical protein
MIINEKNHLFAGNNQAAMWIPVRLLISIAIISCFTTLAIIGSNHVRVVRDQDVFSQEISSIKQSLETLYRHGNCRNINSVLNTPGSKQVFTLIIPETISMMYFGRKPTESKEYASTIRYVSDQTTNMLFMSCDIHVISAEYREHCWLPNKNYTGFHLSSGKNQFTAELVCDDSDQFIILYTTERY